MKPTLRIVAPAEHSGMIYEVSTPEGEVLHGVTEAKIHIKGGEIAEVWVKFIGVEIDVAGEAEREVGIVASLPHDEGVPSHVTRVPALGKVVRDGE
jgi:hypothetical protein